MSEFPRLPDDLMKNLLQPPDQRTKPLRVVFDSDFDNEIDDPFALAWLLLPNNGVNLKVEALYAAPYSFRGRLDDLLEANTLIEDPPDQPTPEQQALVAKYQGQITSIKALGIEPEQFLTDPELDHVAIGPDEGMERSYQYLRSFLHLMERGDIPLLRGSDRFTEGGRPVESPAVDHLIELARSTTSDDPIYVMGIACATNLASALLLAPDIRDRVVMTWTAGYPTNVTDLVNTSFNLEQDLFASQVLFSSGVPLVYLPGFYIGQQLTLSQPDVEAWFRDTGPVGSTLYWRYMRNPLFPWYGIDRNDLSGRIWNIWDLINIAWLFNPGSVASKLVRSPRLNDEKFWVSDPNGHWIRENYYTSYNSIFPPFVKQLREYDGRPAWGNEYAVNK